MKIFAINNAYNFGTRKQFKKLFSTCCYSGEPFEVQNTKTIEHIVPISQGGKNEYSNYFIVKRTWNEKRSSLPLKDFIRQYPQVQENIIKSVNAQDGKIIDGIEWSKEVKKTLLKVLGEDIFNKNS